MLLGDVLTLINENTNINIWCNDELIAIYDGKNAIEPAYNNRHVLEFGIVNGANKIYIEVA